MIGMDVTRNRAQAMFFDRPAIQRAIDRATARALNRSGAMIRLTARRSIRRRKKPSMPGQPPSSPTGILRESILYGFDPRQRSVVAGPALRRSGAGDGGTARTVPALLEGGGRVRRRGKRGERGKTLRYQPRPFMGPAFRKIRSRLPRKWANSVK